MMTYDSTARAPQRQHRWRRWRHETLQWNVTVLLGWVSIALVLEHVESDDKLLARMAWLNDLIHIATCSGDVGIGKLVLVVVYQFLPPFLRVGGVLYLIFKDDVDGTVHAHHGDLSGWPGIINISAYMLA